jgi:hypothetical protein
MTALPRPDTDGGAHEPRQGGRREQARRLIRALQDSDLGAVDEAVLRLSRSRR